MGARTLRKSLREGWWEDVEAADSAHTGERRDCEASPTLASLRALAEAKIQPTVYAGSSAGALVAAAAAYDLSLSEMERLAARLHRKSLFQIDVLGLLRYGTGALSLYRSAPLRELCVELR